MSTATRPGATSRRGMHPLFAELFLPAGEELLADEDERRRARRAGRGRARRTTTVTSRGRPPVPSAR